MHRCTVIAASVLALVIGQVAGTAAMGRLGGEPAAPLITRRPAAPRVQRTTATWGALRQAGPVPFDPFPAVTLPTTDGSVELGGGPHTESKLLLVHSPVSVFGEQMWAGDVKRLLELSPKDAHYIFASYADTPEAVAADLGPLAQRIEEALLPLPAEEKAHWSNHLHFVTVNPLSLGGDFGALLEAWGSIVTSVRAVWQDDEGAHDLTLTSTSDSGWAIPITQTLTAPVAYYGKACGDELPAQDPAGRLALIERGVCYFTEKVLNAEKHGAIGAIVYDDGRGKLTMGGTCDPCPRIPVVMIDQQPGLDIRGALEAARSVTATLTPQEVGAEALGQDHQGRVRELGEVPYAFNYLLLQAGQQPVDIMESFAYETQYYNYEYRRDNRLRAEEASAQVTLLPLLTDEWVSDPDWSGQRDYAEVQLPGPDQMARYDTLEVELSLGCEDNRKANCPIWDYIDNLYLCDATEPEHCDLEVARWITGYDTYGQWVTDISPMLAFLSQGGTRRFAFYNQQRYRVGLRLRLGSRGKAVIPKRAVELPWRGGSFARGYNAGRQPARFLVPDWASKVELVAFITGHGGNDDNGCGEFCNHTHHFQINGRSEHVLRNDVVDATNTEGMFSGCKNRVPDGVVANQGGTWVYGRAGWCPGLDVPPWSADVTADVVVGGWNTISYRGLFNGQDYESTYEGQTDTPPPGGWDARIDMRAYIVYSAPPEVMPEPLGPVLHRWLFLPWTRQIEP